MVIKQRSAAHERKHLNEQERQFKTEVRRNRLLGLWAAGKMGLDGETAAAYAAEVVAADFEKPGEDDVRRKVLDDFAAKGIIVAESELDQKMATFLDEARAQILQENP